MTERAPSQYVGDVGDEVELTGFVNFIGDVKSAYDKPRSRYIVSALGDTVTFFGSLNRVTKGDRIRFTGEVKEHKKWNGTLQTELAKVKLLENITTANARS